MTKETEQRKLTCKKCGGDKFSFTWVIESPEYELSLLYCHDGFGFSLERAIISCAGCGAKSQYEQEDFLEISEETTDKPGKPGKNAKHKHEWVCATCGVKRVI